MTATRADGQVREVLSLFDAKAVGWPAKYAPDGPLAVRLARLAAAVGRAAQAGDRALDLGCGTGELARALAAAGYGVTGCDISREMLTRAASAQGAREGGGSVWVRLRPGWRTLPFTSGAFGAVVASSVLEYVPDPARRPARMRRVTRPGGAVRYTVPDLRHPVRWVEWPAAWLASGRTRQVARAGTATTPTSGRPSSGTGCAGGWTSPGRRAWSRWTWPVTTGPRCASWPSAGPARASPGRMIGEGQALADWNLRRLIHG